MPNKKISQLPVITSLTGTETIPALKDSIVKKTTTGVVTNRMKDLARYSNYSAIQDIKESAKETLFEGLSAGSVLQQDITAVSGALHRSPNAVTAMFVYDTSKDSDGGAWTEKCQHTSWYNEPLNGKWLGAQTTEANARAYNATLGSELITNGDFNSNINGWTVYGDASTTIAWDSGRAFINAATTSDGLFQTIATVIGRIYVVTASYQLGNATTVTGTTNSSDGVSVLSSISSGSLYFIFTASSTSTAVRFTTSSTSTGTFYIDNISVKEVLSTSTQTNDYFQLTTDGKFYALSKNLLTTTNTLATQTQWLTAGTYTLSSTTASTGSVAISGAATATHTAGGAATTFTVATSGAVTFTVTGSVTNAQLEVGSVATVYKANTSTNRYTEVFRGNKAEFPKLAGIVIESSSYSYGRQNIIIYDLTEKNTPMWMVFYGDVYEKKFVSGGYIKSLYAFNGLLAIGQDYSATFYGHLRIANFINDSMNKYVGYYNYSVKSRQQIVNRNFDSVGFNFGHGDIGDIFVGNGIVNGVVNSISMTALSDSPIDSTTGLKVPTIAVATNGGISIIKHDGTVVNSALTNAFNSIAVSNKSIVASTTANNTFYYALNPGKLSSGFAMLTDTSASAPDFNIGTDSNALVRTSRSTYIRSTTNVPALQILKHNENTLGKSMSATITDTYNTGYQIGDIRRTYLSDTTVGTLPDQSIIYDRSYKNKTATVVGSLTKTTVI